MLFRHLSLIKYVITLLCTYMLSIVIGDLGEYIAVDYYCSITNLPKLQSAPIGTQNIDAISINDYRYIIKSTSTTTDVFYGLNESNS